MSVRITLHYCKTRVILFQIVPPCLIGKLQRTEARIDNEEVETLTFPTYLGFDQRSYGMPNGVVDQR